jgi:hypothetical protein
LTSGPLSLLNDKSGMKKEGTRNAKKANRAVTFCSLEAPSALTSNSSKLDLLLSCSDMCIYWKVQLCLSVTFPV